MWYALTLAVLSCLNKGGIFTVKWGGRFTEIIFTVNMPPIENSPHKTGKSMLFFTFEMPLFSVMSINSQIYMTKPKQARKTLSENTGKTFSVIMPPFSSKGGAKLRKWLYIVWFLFSCYRSGAACSVGWSRPCSPCPHRLSGTRHFHSLIVFLRLLTQKENPRKKW